MTSKAQSLQPILKRNHKAKWIKVTKELVQNKKDVTDRIIVRQRLESDVPPYISVVACQNYCGKFMSVGSRVLAVYIKSKKRPIIYCSVECQRQGYLQSRVEIRNS